MRKIKIMHMADFHIGLDISFLGNQSRFRKAEVLEGFRKTCSLANENNIDIILIAGDFLESSTIEPAYIAQVKSILEKVNAKVFIVAGNHDYISLNSPYMDEDWPANVHIFKNSWIEKVKLDDLNVDVFGASFTSTYQRESFLDSHYEIDDKKINIMVLHGDNTEDSLYNPMGISKIKDSKMRYIALGHIHKKPDLGMIGQTYFSYAGSPVGQSFNELGERSVMIIEIDQDHTSLSEMTINSKAFYREKINVSKMTSSKEAYDLIIQLISKKYGNYQDNYYQIILEGEIEEGIYFDFDVIEQLLGNLRYVKVIDETKVKLNYDRVRKEQSLKGIFVDKMLNLIEDAKYSEDEEKVLIYERAFELGLRALEGYRI
ncbi:MAG: hypothetical protein GXY87_05225 [Tissierellia bacterium]|nr:hypothetical protein [Tissierellia bacterium]